MRMESVKTYLAWRVGGGKGLLCWNLWCGELEEDLSWRREELESGVLCGKKRRTNRRVHNYFKRKKEKIEGVG